MRRKPRTHITWKSSNVKTGPMTVTRTTSETCPESCPLLGNGCYDQQGNGAIHRRRVDAEQYTTYTATEFMKEIPRFTMVWRMNEGGDLWGKGDTIDGDTLQRFAEAVNDAGNMPIVYTHKPIAGVTSRGDGKVRVANQHALRRAVRAMDGTINISCDTLQEADNAKDRGFDATVVVPHDAEGPIYTPAGRRVVMCPAQERDITCSTCKLCAKKRKGIVGFKAHGGSAKKISKRLKIYGQEG